MTMGRYICPFCEEWRYIDALEYFNYYFCRNCGWAGNGMEVKIEKLDRNSQIPIREVKRYDNSKSRERWRYRKGFR